MELIPLQTALLSAPRTASPAVAPEELEFFCFRIGDLHLGVPSENVREVIPAAPLTPIPKIPAFVLGVCGHRGEVLPVIDLLRFFGKGECKIGRRTRYFIGMTQEYVAAVVCDDVTGLRRIPVARILPPPMSGDASAEHLIGIEESTRGDEPLALLNFSKLLISARQRAVSR